MNFLVKVVNALFDKTYRDIKILKLGGSDVQTVSEASPFGLDSSPIAGMTAIYSETLDDSDPVIIGYMNANQIADAGEFRTYSTDADGNVKTYTWLKKDGTIEIGGNAHNLVRYIPLDNSLQGLVNFLNAQLQAIATGISGAGGVYAPGTASLDISGAKINEIKTL